MRVLWALAFAVALVGIARAEASDGVVLSIGEADIDGAAARVAVDGVTARAASSAELRAIFGQERGRWEGGSAADDKASTTFCYLLPFKQPQQIGTVILDGSVDAVAWLKPGAAAPTGDEPLDPTQDRWVVQKYQGSRSTARTFANPTTDATQALLLIDHEPKGDKSRIERCQLLGPRMFNLTARGSAYALENYTNYPHLGSPVHYHAGNLVDSWRGWKSTGENRDGYITRPPISEVAPTWVMVSWQDAQQISGIWLKGNASKIEIDQFVGSNQINPRAGTPREWQVLTRVSRKASRENDEQGWWIDLPDVETRGLRLRITQVDSKSSPIATLEALNVLQSLGDGPVPVDAALEDVPPPVRIPLELAHEGVLTVAINDMDGRRVANLVARANRPAGKTEEGWDLSDLAGNVVPVGSYQYKAIYHPPLKFKYQMTPYPNVQDFSDERAPWPAGGPHGWMTNHTAPQSIAASGDMLVAGAPVPEGGSSLVAFTNQGVKQWGVGNFGPFTGPRYLAAHEGTAYVVTPHENDVMHITAADMATGDLKTLIKRKSGADYPGRVVGIEASGEFLYLAVEAATDQFAAGVEPGDVDFAASLPRPAPEATKKSLYDVVPDQQSELVRLLRLKGTPPGQRNHAWNELPSTSSREPRQHLMVSFKKPVTIGSIAYPKPTTDKFKVKFSLLKPDAKYPPQRGDSSAWVDFEQQGEADWAVAVAPADTPTRALLVTYYIGEDDIFTQTSSEAVDPNAALDASLSGGIDMSGLGDGGALQKSSEPWAGYLHGLKMFKNRYRNIAPQAHVQVSSGHISKRGHWSPQRTEPIVPNNPAVMTLAWDEPQKIAGIAIKEMEAAKAAFDIYVGPAGSIDYANDAHWQQVATYTQQRRYFYNPDVNHNSEAHYIDGYVDFGGSRETRAVRMRLIEPFLDQGGSRPYGFHADRGGRSLDPARGDVFGIAVLQPVDDLVLPPNGFVEIYNRSTGEFVKRTPIDKPRAIAAGPDGKLLAISGDRVVAVDFEAAAHQPVIEDLQSPRALAIDQQQQVYVYDAAEDRNQVRVYDSHGQYQRSVGTPGGRKAGHWNPDAMYRVRDIDVDGQGSLWIAENDKWPKRVASWDSEGKHRLDLLGPTQYGGGGLLDRWDKSRHMYGAMEYRLDWQTGKSQLHAVTWLGSHQPERPIHLNDRIYMVNRNSGGNSPTGGVGVVYLYNDGVCKPAAAVGYADQWAPLNDLTLRAAVGEMLLQEEMFTWADLNGDGEVQANEVTLRPLPEGVEKFGVTEFTHELSITAGPVEFVVDRFLPTGVPVYKIVEHPKLSGAMFRLDNGLYHIMGGHGGSNYERGVTADGQVVWQYPTQGAGVHSLYRATAWQPDQIVAQFGFIGHDTTHAGDLGEFTVLSTNVGTWNVWTADGLLAAQLFKDIRDPSRQAWSMHQADRGMSLDDITVGQEHFYGFFGRTIEDNRYYAVAGHMHSSIVEVEGFDQFKRIEGTLEITPDLIRETEAWRRTQEQKKVYDRAPVIVANKLNSPKGIDGNLEDWAEPVATIGERASFYMGYTPSHLYLAWQTKDCGPLNNTGDDWRKAFVTGGGVDLKISANPDADPTRKGPAEGDQRLLITRMNGELMAILYRPIAPGASPDERLHVVSPVAELEIQQVVKLDNVMLAADSVNNSYTVEAAVPLEALGLTPDAGERLRMDWGLLITGREGHDVLERLYWANKSTAITTDAPSEAALHPNLWGHVLFEGAKRSLFEDRMNESLSPSGSGGSKAIDSEFNDVLEELGGP